MKANLGCINFKSFVSQPKRWSTHFSILPPFVQKLLVFLSEISSARLCCYKSAFPIGIETSSVKGEGGFPGNPQEAQRSRNHFQGGWVARRPGSLCRGTGGGPPPHPFPLSAVTLDADHRRGRWRAAAAAIFCRNSFPARFSPQQAANPPASRPMAPKMPVMFSVCLLLAVFALGCRAEGVPEVCVVAGDWDWWGLNDCSGRTGGELISAAFLQFFYIFFPFRFFPKKVERRCNDFRPFHKFLKARGGTQVLLFATVRFIPVFQNFGKVGHLWRLWPILVSLFEY